MATISTERDGRVMTVRVDNPPRNLMNRVMVAELDELTRELESDRSVGAVVITGAKEKLFVTHYDVRELIEGAEGNPALTQGVARGLLRAVGVASRIPGVGAALGRTPAAGVIELRRLHALSLRMNRMDKVFVAAVNGMATGAGFELALACDIRIVAEGEFVIGLPEMSIGLIPGGGASQRVARALGPAKAIELLLEARPLGPREAFEAGLVHRVVPPEQLLEQAQATAERLARRSPVTVAAAKRAVYEGGSYSLQEGLRVEQSGFMAAVSSQAARRALAAFADQIDQLDEAVPSPWADPAKMRAWQEGTAVDMTG
jgi:enoyl-CoA hydratase